MTKRLSYNMFNDIYNNHHCPIIKIVNTKLIDKLLTASLVNNMQNKFHFVTHCI